MTHRFKTGLQFIARIVVVSVLLAVAGCGSSDSTKTLTVTGTNEATGNAWSVVVVDAQDQLTKQSLRKTVSAVLSKVRTQIVGANSALERFNHAAARQWIDVPRPFAGLVQQTLALGRATIGAYDVTRRPLLKLWGKAGLSAPGQPPSRKSIAQARSHTGIGLVTVREQSAALRKTDSQLGLYLADVAAAYRARLLADQLQPLGAVGWRIRFGDTVLVHGSQSGHKPFTVAVRTRSHVLHVELMGDRAVASAAVPAGGLVIGRRRFSAVIDPRTGRPVAHRGHSVTVVSDNAVRAAAMARALLVMGPEAGRQFANARDIAALFVRSTAGNKPPVLYSRTFKQYLAKS